jgi:hypothetical protein
MIRLSFAGSILDVQSFAPGLKEGGDVVELKTSVEHAFVVKYLGISLNRILNILSGDAVTA